MRAAEPKDPEVYLSFSDGKYRVIQHGLPISADKVSSDEALAVAKHYNLAVSDMMWNGDIGQWVPLWRRGPAAGRPGSHLGMRAAEPYLQHGERVRIRIRGAKGQPFEAFWYTVPSAMTPSEVALHFAQTGQPGMITEIQSGRLKWAFQQSRLAGVPTVTPVHAGSHR